MNDVSLTAARLVSPVAFAGRPGFIRLLLKNALLSIVTLGFYRFWARTAVRRALWNNVVIGGEPLEYTGRGIELFIGFLIALAILAPLAAIYGAIQYLAFASPETVAVAQILYFAILGVLIQVAIFRARRYRLSRTQWRGIRGWQDGSSWRYVGISLLYGLLTLVTLGLAMPWLNTALQRYKINHTIFGNGRFNFTGRGRDLILRWLVVYMIAAVPIIGFIALNAGIFAEIALILTGDGGDLEELAGEISGWWLLPFIYIGGGIAFLWYRVAEFRYFVSHTEFGAVRLASAARLRRIVLIFLGYIGSMFLLVAVLAAIFLGVGFAASQVTDEVSIDMLVNPTLGVTIVLGGAALLLGSYILAQYFMTYRIARHIVSTITIANLPSLESVLQSAEARPRYGEGLADAFDIGAV